MDYIMVIALDCCPNNVLTFLVWGSTASVCMRVFDIEHRSHPLANSSSRLTTTGTYFAPVS
mgnify:CR=1 FL=1